MLRRPSRQPEWVKMLMQEMLKPPQFIQGIMEDQQNNKKTNGEGSAASADHSGAGPQSSASASDSDSEEEARRTSTGSGWPRRKNATPGHSQETDVEPPGKASQMQGPKRPKTGSNGRPSPIPNAPPSMAMDTAATKTEPSDAEDWVPLSVQADNAELDSKDWRRALRSANFPSTLVKQFGWKVTAAEPYQNIVQIKTAKGTFALKESGIDSNRILFLHQLTQHARKHGFTHVARFAVTKQQRPYARQDNRVFYATRWISGRAVRFSSKQDVGKVAEALADFHEASKGFESEQYNPPMEFDLKQMFKRRYEDLKILLAQADAKSSKGTFDRTFLELEEQLRKDADASLALLDDPDCLDFLLHEEFQPGVCHLDVIPSNFIYDDTKTVHLVDLDLATYAPRVLDISHLLRRALQVQDWNSEIAYVVFLNYDKVKRITQEEYTLILALLRFPYRAWRLASTRYRVLAEPGQVSALRRYKNQEDARQQFLRDLEAQIT